MDVTVQEAIQQLITALIKSLGSGHGKLLTLMRTFPPGSETLALRVLNIFSEQGSPSTQVVTLVKSLMNERDLDARFLIPIIAEMDKVSAIRVWGCDHLRDVSSDRRVLTARHYATLTPNCVDLERPD